MYLLKRCINKYIEIKWIYGLVSVVSDLFSQTENMKKMEEENRNNAWPRDISSQLVQGNRRKSLSILYKKRMYQDFSF